MMGHLQLAEVMRRHGQAPGQSKSISRHGTVSSYQPNTHAVKVLLQPENIESNWMPLGALAVGNGWGICAAPQIGDQVLVLFVEGDFSTAVAVSRTFSISAPAPVLKAGEFVLQHSSGSLLKFNADGTVNLTSQGTLTTSAPQWNHNGPVSINGNVATTGTLTNNGVDVSSTHTHGGVKAGSSSTSTPNA